MLGAGSREERKKSWAPLEAVWAKSEGAELEIWPRLVEEEREKTKEHPLSAKLTAEEEAEKRAVEARSLETSAPQSSAIR